MEMSSPGEETYFAKKIVHLSFLFEKRFGFHKKKNPYASPKLSLLHPIPHTIFFSGGGGSNRLLRGLAAGAGEGGGANLRMVPKWYMVPNGNTFRIFRLIARNVRELFSYNRIVSHFLRSLLHQWSILGYEICTNN